MSFAKAGIQLATTVGGGAMRGLETTLGEALSAYGLDVRLLRYLGMGMAGLVVVMSLLVIVGLPIRWILRPVVWMFRPLGFAIKRIVPKRPLRGSASKGEIPIDRDHLRVEA